MRTSKYFLPTLREASAEAETVSHQLMLRAGLIRKQASGVYSYLPLGYKILKKVENIIREEMDSAGSLEILGPAIQPAELWKESQRWDEYGDEMFRLKDRHNREFCLGPTHEEIFTDIVRNDLRSYRNLPLSLYQIQSKYRDERRPRFGVMRSREFIMKDGYSFDIDQDGLDLSYDKMFDAYKRILSRLDLKYQVVEADSGNIGGSHSHEFMVISEVGEDDIIYCAECGYAANLEKAVSKITSIKSEEAPKELKQVDTPNASSIDEVADFLNVLPHNIVKARVYTNNERMFVALVKGDQKINETKLNTILDTSLLEPASEEEIKEIKSEAGFTGPLNLKDVTIICDKEVEKMRNFVVGGNKKGVHLINCNIGRDFTPDIIADIRSAKEGESCTRCGEVLSSSKGIEVGHIFKLGTKYSESLNATVLDKDGKEKPLLMGCYGIGVNRLLAAVIEQNHDEDGIIWPKALGPFQVSVIPVNVKKEEQLNLAEDIYDKLKDKFDVIIDDRKERVGVKFKDHELIGVPVQIIVGKNAADNQVEIKYRQSKDKLLLDAEKVVEALDSYF
ncbi:proline--tRNA ligase [Proteinivorax hydrogeniformans]|uniref:Proline--tRNA ligase n=1 Tax=Proteinivorax hydrogeniformans TaxID=1826727 RepID=A0AAU8HNW7_9FIRM